MVRFRKQQPPQSAILAQKIDLHAVAIITAFPQLCEAIEIERGKHLVAVDEATKAVTEADRAIDEGRALAAKYYEMAKRIEELL